MAAVTTELILKTIVEGTENALSQIKSLKDKVNGAADALVGFGKTTSLFVTAPIVLAGMKMLNAAGDAAETQNKFEAVFGDLKGEAESFAATLGAAVNRNTTDIKNGMSAFQSFAVGLGYSKKEAIGFSEQLQSMSLDFASFYNLSDDEAMGRFISAMSGSSEVLDQFGVNIKQAALDLELQSLGLGKSAANATELEKAQARLSIITRTLTNNGVMGDAIKTSGSYANQLKGLHANVKTLAEIFGNILIPRAQQVISSLRKLAEAFTKLPTATKETILNVLALAAAIGPASIALGTMLKAVALLISPIGLMAVAVIALGAALVYAYNESETFRNVVNGAFDGLVTIVTSVASGIKAVWNTVGPVIVEGFSYAVKEVGALFKDIIKEAQDWAKIFAPIFNVVFGAISSTVATVGSFIVNNWQNIKDVLSGIFTLIFEPLKIAFTFIYSTIKGFMQIITGDVEGGFTTLAKSVESIGNSLKNTISAVWAGIKGLFFYGVNFVIAVFGDMWVSLKNGASSLGNGVLSIVSNIWDSIRNGFQELADSAFNWGANMVQGFVDGIKSAPGKVKDAVVDIANTISDYIGFSSPTDKGPGSKSDTWAPNFIDMFAKGLSAGADKISQAISRPVDIITKALGLTMFEQPKAAIADYVSHVKVQAQALNLNGGTLFKSIGTELLNFSTRVAALPKDLQDPFEQSVKLFQSFTDNYRTGMQKLESDFDKDSDSISEKIGKLNEDLQSLNDGFTLDSSDQNKQLAAQFVAQKKKIDEIKNNIEAKQKEIADNSVAIVADGLEEQDAKQTAALLEKKLVLDQDLQLLESSLSLEQKALDRARSYKIGISAEIRDAQKRDRQSDFTNFIEDWTAKKQKSEEEYNLKKQSLEMEVSDLQAQRDQMLVIYKESQKTIMDSYSEAKDAYLANLNEQALGTEYYTDLMSSYFDKMTEKMKGTDIFLPSVMSLPGVLGNTQSPSANSVIAPKLAGGSVSGGKSAPTVNLSVAVENFIGQDSYARKLFDSVVKQAGQRISSLL